MLLFFLPCAVLVGTFLHCMLKEFAVCSDFFFFGLLMYLFVCVFTEALLLSFLR